LKNEESRVSIVIGDKDHTSGILLLPSKGRKRTAMIITHGAGNDMNICGFLIPSFFIRDANVKGLMSRILAAPLGP
jgi:hypothetical protein